MSPSASKTPYIAGIRVGALELVAELRTIVPHAEGIRTVLLSEVAEIPLIFVPER
jgi:hypothetical protein